MPADFNFKTKLNKNRYTKITNNLARITKNLAAKREVKKNINTNNAKQMLTND